MWRTPLLAALVVLCAASHARAQGTGHALEVTLDRAFALARARAPAPGVAAARVEEARGKLEGASAWLRENPAVEVGLGPRVAGTEGLAVEAEVRQVLELGGGRRARIDEARADISRALAGHDDALRRALHLAGAAFYRAIHAEERLALARRAEELASATARIAERRHRAGDVPLLHVNVAQANLARVRAEAQGAEAALAGAEGELRLALGLEAHTRVRVRGRLTDRARIEALVAAAGSRGERSDVRAAGHRLAQAQAQYREGRALLWPELGIGARYTQEEPGSAAVLGLVELRLPLFARGQGMRAEALARQRRLRLELAGTRRRVQVEAAAAREAYRREVAAVAALESAAPLLEQNEDLARRSYEKGELGLAELLLLRREALDTSVEFLGRQLDAALAGLELVAAVGGLP